MNKKTRIILINLSLFLLFLSAILVITKISPAFSVGGAWCDYNPSCISSPCYCDTGNKSATSCGTGKWSAASSDSYTDCGDNCSAGTTDGYSYSEIKHGKSASVSKDACYRTNGGEYTATANCNDGTVTISGESSLDCFEPDYKYTFGSWYESNHGCYYVCVDDTCASGTLDGYSYSAMTHGDNESVSKSVTGGSCTATANCGDGSVWISAESCNCNAGYYESSGSCLTCSTGYYCTGDGTRTDCGYGMTSPSGSDALGDCVCVNDSEIIYDVWQYSCYSNCDGSLSNGCEVHSTSFNACAAGDWNSDPGDGGAICCGDGSCVSGIGETTTSCNDDCGYCGDGYCIDETPTTCSDDCGWCGDGFCNTNWEDSLSCNIDCGGDHKPL